MSAASSRASAASTSASSGPECRPPGKSSATPTAGRSSRATSPRPRDSRTSERSARTTSRRSASSAAASPVKTSAPPGGEPDSMAPARVFGPSSPGSFASYDPATSSWRTSPPCSPARGSAGTARRPAEFSETWPKQGMTRSGRSYRLESSGHRTCESGSGSWPTPHGMPKREQRRRPGPSGNELGRAVLAAERESFPTPTATDARKGYASAPGPSNRRGRQTLSGAVHARLWPTPTHRLGTPRGPQAKRYHDPKRSNDLDDAVAASLKEPELFPTPTASNTKAHHMRSGDRPARSYGTTGQLNPAWVEWLMGFPIGWTVLAPSETPSSRRSPSGSGSGSSSTSKGRAATPSGRRRSAGARG